MKITDNAVFLPKLSEVNPKRASSTIGEKASVEVPRPAPAVECKTPNAAGEFEQRTLEELHSIMQESGKVAARHL